MDIDDLKILAEKRNIDYEYEKRALEIIKKFVIERKRIVFGGYAIDKFLRLKGSKIYHDEEKPDIDIYSPDSVGDAYDIVDIFRKAGFEQVAAIRGVHIQTMRVRTNFIYVIDIGYVPPEIYEKIPYLNSNGMRVVHPLYQRIDFHISFSFPFSGAPRENILNRWDKDAKRLEIINEYYPIDLKYMDPKTKKIKIPKPGKDYALAGLASYAASYTSLIQLITELSLDEDISDIPKIIISAEGEYLQLESPEDDITLISPINDVTHASYGDKIPAYKKDDNYPIKIFSSHLELLSICKVKINSIEFISTSIHHTMMYLLAMYSKTKHEYYLSYYYGAQKIMKIAGKIYEKLEMPFIDTPFSSCIDVLGTKNMNKAYLIRMAKNIRITGDYTNYPKYIDSSVETILKGIPSEYYDTRPPPFDYEKSLQFYQIGQKIKD